MSNLAEVKAQADALIEAALKVVMFERAIARDDHALNATLKAEQELALTAKALTAAIDEMPFERQPKGWHR